MTTDEIIYKVRERMNAISDDRYIDERLILDVVDNVRADFIQKTLARRPAANTGGLTQDLEIDVIQVSRSVIPACPLNCTVMRSAEKIPQLIYEGTMGNWWDVKTADVTYRWFETVEPERVGFLVWDFNVIYVAIIGDYLYFLSKEDQLMQCALLTGVFESPTDVEDPLTDYPLLRNMWNQIEPLVVEALLNKPAPDPINNSEPDMTTPPPIV